MKLEEEAVFFAGPSIGQRSRSVSYKVDFYSDKAFDLAIQEAINQNETKSLHKGHRTTNSTQPSNHIDHAVVALCDPMRRQTRAVSRLAAAQGHLGFDRHEELSGNESSSDETELLSETVSSDCEERDSAYSYHSSETKSEETAMMSDSSCKAISDKGQELYNWRKPHSYHPNTCVNQAYRKIRTSSRIAAQRLCQMIKGESEFETESEQSDEEDLSHMVSSDSDVTSVRNNKSDTWSQKRQVRLMICEDSSSDNSSVGRGSLAAIEKQYADSKFGNSSSQKKGRSASATWRSRRHMAKTRNSHRLLQDRKQHSYHNNILHPIRKDHCYARINNCMHFEQTPDSQEIIQKRPAISGESTLPVIPVGIAGNLITSQIDCNIFLEDRMDEDDIDSFSSDVELTRATGDCEDNTINVLPSS